MSDDLNLGSNSQYWQLNRQLRFPPFLTLYAGAFAVWAWCAFTFYPVGGLDASATQLLRVAILLWAAFTACFFIVTRQPQVHLKIAGCVGFVFSVFSLAVTIAKWCGY